MEGQAGVPAYPVRGLLMSNGSDGNLFSVCKLLHVAEPPSTSYQRSGGVVPGNFGRIGQMTECVWNQTLLGSVVSPHLISLHLKLFCMLHMCVCVHLLVLIAMRQNKDVDGDTRMAWNPPRCGSYYFL